MRRHAATLALLLAVSAAVQCWMVRAAATPALDAVRYAAIAGRMERDGLGPTLRRESEHPLFPLLVYAAHHVRRAVLPTSPDDGAAVVQLAAAVPLWLCVVPVYFLLLRTFDARYRIAVGGTLLFCLLPATARLGADGISDSTHLLLAATALWAIVEWLARPTAAWLLLSGGTMGLALTARAEAVLIAPALSAVLIWDQFHVDARRPWRQVALGGGSLLLGVAVVLGPYLISVQATTPRRAVARILGRGDGPASVKTVPAGPARIADSKRSFLDGRPLVFPAKETSTSTRFRGLVPAAREYARELAEVFHFGLGLLALWGAWTERRGWRSADRLFAVLFAGVSLAALYVGARAGYLASRHLLLIVPVGLGWAAVGADDLGGRMASLLGFAGTADACRSAWAARRSLGGGLAIVLATILCLPRLAAPLHASREGHRQAGEWLAAQPETGLVLDTRGWTGLYSGLETRRYDEARAAFRDARLAYVVVERPELEFASPRAETLRRLLAASATLAAEFDAGNGANVVVYRWQPDRVASSADGRRE